MPGKRIQFDDETYQAVDLLGRDQMKTFQELADEAFCELLRKHGRPTNLKEALKRSANASDSNVHRMRAPKKKPQRKKRAA